MLRINLFIVVFSNIVFFSAAQDIHFPDYQTGSDTVINHKQLNSFFAKLSKLETSDSVFSVNILHIGDSHIQADFLTREIRNSFQKKFGNAGRGLVFPFRLTKTNESSDFRSSTTSHWKTETVRTRNRSFEPGIAGATIACPEDVFNFKLKLAQRDSVDNSYNKLKLICRNDSDGLLAFVQTYPESNRNLLAFTGDTIYETSFSSQNDNFEIQSYGNLLVDGIVLENNLKGVEYHVVGVNGAHYADYNRSPVFFDEMPLLQPDLILISLGTNEGVNAHISTQSVVKEATAMIQNIRSRGIDAPIVLLTPFDNYYRRRKLNSYLSTVRKALLETCEIGNIACLDMYAISGGYGSAANWRKAGFMASDRIHYSVGGYTLQGKMIYKALINSYSKYAAR